MGKEGIRGMEFGKGEIIISKATILKC